MAEITSDQKGNSHTQATSTKSGHVIQGPRRARGRRLCTDVARPPVASATISRPRGLLMVAEATGGRATSVHRRRPRARLGPWITWPLFVLVACVWLLPFWSLVISAMKSAPEYTRTSVWALPGHPLTLFHNMQVAWQTGGLGPGFLTSLFYGMAGAALAIVLAPLGALS